MKVYKFSESIWRFLSVKIKERIEFVVINDKGTKYWYKGGRFHREGGPAIEYKTGGKEWYQEGELHREEGPAVECPDGSKYWCKEGELHRKEGPAVERADGSKEWWEDGVRMNLEEM